jgi:hypothetical protein
LFDFWTIPFPETGADVTGIGRIDKGEAGSYLSRAAAVPVFPFRGADSGQF